DGRTHEQYERVQCSGDRATSGRCRPLRIRIKLVRAASIADCRTPAAPLPAAADHFPIGIAPAAAPSPPAVPRSGIATLPIIGRAGGVARTVIGARDGVGPGNAEP